MSEKEFKGALLPKVPADAPDTEEEFMNFMKQRYPNASVAELQTSWITHSNKDLTSRIVETMNIYGETLVQDMKEKFATMVHQKVKQQEQAIVNGIMEGLGLEANPVAKINDVETIVRKILLEQEIDDSGRKTKLGKSGGSPDGDEETEDDTEEKSRPFNFAKRLSEDDRRFVV